MKSVIAVLVTGNRRPVLFTSLPCEEADRTTTSPFTSSFSPSCKAWSPLTFVVIAEGVMLSDLSNGHSWRKRDEPALRASTSAGGAGGGEVLVVGAET